MAGPNTPTGAIQNKVEAVIGAGAFTRVPASTNDFAKIKAAFATAAPPDATAIGSLSDCTAFGPLSLRGNNATWIEFGEGSESSLPAPATPNEFPLTFVITESVAIQKALLDASVGDDIAAVCIVSAQGHTSQNAAENDVAYLVRGAVSGVDINFDTPRSCTLNISLAGRPQRIDA